MKKEDEDLGSELVEGSKYKIRSLFSREETLVTSGEFKGYMFIGRDQALKMELDDTHEEAGLIRIIPSHMIIHIDIITQVPRKKEKGKKTGAYFG